MAGMSPLTSTARYPLVPLGSSFRVVGAEGVDTSGFDDEPADDEPVEEPADEPSGDEG